MSMNVGMLACYDQAKEIVAKLLGDEMIGGPSLTTKLGSSAIAVRVVFVLVIVFKD
jgi:solute carrier family 25 oxoglutarate transporter 11